jgi:hypothetical protein
VPGETESNANRPIESAIVLLDPSVMNATANGRPERLSNVTPVTRTDCPANTAGARRATSDSLRIFDMKGVTPVWSIDMSSTLTG